MSTLAVDTITKADGSGALSVPAESGTVVTTASPSLGRRNLIINGAMQVAQRGTSFTGVSNADYTLDRFESGSSGTELVYNVEQSTDAPNGFSNSYKVTVTTAETTLSSGDNMTVKYNFEGQDLQQIKKGTSDALKVTLSFFVKSSVASTYSLELFDQDNTRVHGQKYTISSADTWEYKTITFDGDTSGSLDNDANKSMRLQFWLDAGSEYTSGTQSTTWQSNTASERVEQATGFMTTVNATWQITGVQLEVGSVATPFEHRSYGEELALCQRYYQLLAQSGGGGGNWFVGQGAGTTQFIGKAQLACPMRATPDANDPSQWNIIDADTYDAYSSGDVGAGVPAVQYKVNNTHVELSFTGMNAGTVSDNRPCFIYMYNKLELDAEL